MPATINALPTPPSRSAPSVFSERADAFLAALPSFVSQANALAAEVEAAAQMLSSPGLSATSTTSLAVSLGTKSLTVQTGKSFVVGMSVKIAYSATATIWMHGDVTAYDPLSGALVVVVTVISGSGTYALWTVSLSAPIADNPEFAAATKMYFYQDTAPVGWTIDAAVSDCCLAVKGGSNAFNVAGGNRAGAWAMTTAQMPIHNHANTASSDSAGGHSHTVTIPVINDDNRGSGGFLFDGDDGTTNGVTPRGTNDGGGHSHSISLSNANAGSGAATYRPYSAVGIIAAKD